MSIIYLDFETRSKAKLAKVGSFKYFEDPSTDILCLCYSVDDSKTHVWTPSMLKHRYLWETIQQKGVKLYGWNTTFELTAWQKVMVERYGWPALPDQLWYDVQATAVSKGYPADLDSAAPALHLKRRKSYGKALLKFFSEPNKDGTFNEPYDHAENFQNLIEYCEADVEVTREAHQLIGDLPPREREIWLHTLTINRRGVAIDSGACRNIITHLSTKKAMLNDGITSHTGGQITKVTQRDRIKNWLRDECRLPLANMQGNYLLEVLDNIATMEPTERLIEAKILIGWYLKGSKSSTAKYDKMLDHLCADLTVKGFLFYHGAGTGRYSGRGVQFQNFPNKTMDNADQVIDCLAEPDLDIVEMTIGDIFDASKQLLRAVIVAPAGMLLCVADYKSIEAVGSAWACNEKEILQSFVRGEDQYRRTAAKMYNTEYALVTPDQRFAGKIAVLACGYGGGTNAILGMAEKMRMDVSEGQAMRWTGQFRKARPALVKAWKDTEKAAQQAIISDREGELYSVPSVRGLSFSRVGNDLRMHLPSGRQLNYPEAVIHTSKRKHALKKLVDIDTMEYEWIDVYAVDEMAAMWVDSTTHKWQKRKIYGSLLFQNYIQALCRDILTAAQLRLEERGFPICINVHDELGGLVKNDDKATYNRFHSVMTQRPQWLPTDFPILADGYIAKRYRK